MRVLFLSVFASCFLVGCNYFAPPNPYAPRPGAAPEVIKFADHLESNTPLDSDLQALEFTDQNGQSKSLKELAGGKSLVLVMTRGYTGSICPYCSTQVSRLIANYEQITKRNGQVVVVYPVEKKADQPKSKEFSQKVKSMTAGTKEIPFPILLDVELKGVDKLGIRKDLSKPATYILDADGRIQFAYVGNTLSDRPSVQALVEQLEKINSRPAGG